MTALTVVVRQVAGGLIGALGFKHIGFSSTVPLAGLLMIRAWEEHRGKVRRKVIIPDTAHGTNPASCTLAGFEVIVAPSGPRGYG